MDNLLIDFIMWLNMSFGSEFLSIVEFGFLSLSLLFLFRYFSIYGMIIFHGLSIIIGNIQVLHQAHFFFQSAPVALGTIAFSMTFLTTDIITEHYGPQMARKTILLSFLTQFLFSIMMFITLGYKSITDTQSYYSAIFTLFTPSLRLFIASICAFIMSQLLDVFLFDKIRNCFKGIRWLWLRSNLSTIISAFIDNSIFSILAWSVFSPSPYTISYIFFTFILGTYWLRVIMSICSTPIIYLSYLVQKNPLKFSTAPQ